jgi:hypothetical protein
MAGRSRKLLPSCSIRVGYFTGCLVCHHNLYIFTFLSMPRSTFDSVLELGSVVRLLWNGGKRRLGSD